MNSYFSNFIIERFRTDHLGESKVKYHFMGTINENNDNCFPRYFEPKVIKIDYNPSYKTEGFTNDIFIYNLDTGDCKEVEYIIKGIKNEKLSSEKTIVGISNILTWEKTPKKIKTPETVCEEGDVYVQPEDDYPDIVEKKIKEPENEVIEQDEKDKDKDKEKEKRPRRSTKEGIDNRESEQKSKQETIEAKEDISEQAEISEQVKEEVLYYTENEYQKRIPSQNYIRYKYIENQGLSLSNKENLRVFVICPGFIYGCGEMMFYDYFRLSYLHLPIPLISSHFNSIPTIHIQDLVTLVKRGVEKKISSRYIIAIDQTVNNTGKSIGKSIQCTVGDIAIPPETNLLQYPNVPCLPQFTFDVKGKQSSVFFVAKKNNEDKEDYEKRAFQWHAQFGIKDNMSLIRQEFIEYRGLRSNKLCICGLPFSGKSTIGSIISKIFHLKGITISDITEFGKGGKDRTNLSKADDDGSKEIQAKLAELEANIATAEEQYNKRANKKKTDPPFDSKQYLKLPTELITKIFLRYLKENVCVIDGYILDGYPKTYEEANQGFNHTVTTENGSEVLSINQDILPNIIIKIDDIEENFIVERLKATENFAANPNVVLDRVARRFGKIKETSTSEGFKPIEQFYLENEVKIVKISGKEELRANIAKIKEFVVSNNGGKVNHNGDIMQYNGFEYDYDRECELEIEKKLKEEQERLEKEENERIEKEGKTKADENGQDKDNDKVLAEHENDYQDDDKHLNAIANEISKLEKSIDNEDNQQENNIPDAIQTKGELEKEREIQLLERKSEILRRYLSNNVIPILSKGILEICEKLPDDPVEAGSAYLLDKTFEAQLARAKEEEDENENENDQQQPEDVSLSPNVEKKDNQTKSKFSVKDNNQSNGVSKQKKDLETVLKLEDENV